VQFAAQPDPTPVTQFDLTLTRRHGPWSYPRTLKRGMDLVLALLVLVATLPIWLLIAAAIRIESRGPVIFVQERVGLGRKRFRFYKFRSMYHDAEELRRHLLHLNEVSGPVFKIRSDPRVTRVGRLLRRTSLDELPQLLNILKGEMSLVGPRPARPEEVEHYRDSDMARLTVRPGLTCWWQIRGRSDVDFETWMVYDREYVNDVSLLTDVRILLGTFGAVVSARGAY
jgi:lipopolysaccharide/colanic/teichoic acid biosynthesis glycosyltransferase